MSDKFSTIRKLYNLSVDKGATDPEKASAKELLDKLLVKYDISLDDLGGLGETESSFHTFTYAENDHFAESLLQQVIYKVVDDDHVYYAEHDDTVQPILGCYCTESQRTEIEFLYDFYLQLWEEETKYLFAAFVQKHKIFGTPTSNGSNSKYDRKQVAKIFNMVKVLDSKSPIRRLEG